MYVNGLDGQAVAVFDHNDPDHKRYYLLRDQIGSVRMAVKDSGQVVEYVNYHPFGEIAQSWTSYDEPMKFTGHERDTFETMKYTYFGARYYDPELGQFTSIDKAAQFAGGFNYCGNNPIIGVDPDGNFFFALLVPALYASLYSSVAYTAVSLAVTGNFEWDQLGKAAIAGAIGGALTGGISLIGGKLANNMVFGMLSNAGTSAATSAVMGEKVSMASIAGSTVGSMVASKMVGRFRPTTKSIANNLNGELSRGALSGAVSGGVGRITTNALSGRKIFDNALQSTVLGAYTGYATTATKIGLFGHLRPRTDNQEISGALAAQKGEIGYKGNPYYRSGGLWGLAAKSRTLNNLFFRNGFAGQGDEIIINETGSAVLDRETWLHETAHFAQSELGGYGYCMHRWTCSQIRDFFGDYNPYETIGDMEWIADQLSKY
jgi:RHS repeat-associated protein